VQERKQTEQKAAPKKESIKKQEVQAKGLAPAGTGGGAAGGGVSLDFNVEDDVEMEEQVHDNDKMVAMGVIENEMEVMKTLIKHSSGAEKDFYQDKLSSLDFSKGVILLWL
jgi:hypothetical protein